MEHVPVLFCFASLEVRLADENGSSTQNGPGSSLWSTLSVPIRHPAAGPYRRFVRESMKLIYCLQMSVCRLERHPDSVAKKIWRGAREDSLLHKIDLPLPTLPAWPVNSEESYSPSSHTRLQGSFKLLWKWYIHDNWKQFCTKAPVYLICDSGFNLTLNGKCFILNYWFAEWMLELVSFLRFLLTVLLTPLSLTPPLILSSSDFIRIEAFCVCVYLNFHFLPF